MTLKLDFFSTRFELGAIGCCSWFWGRISGYGFSQWRFLRSQGHGCVRLCHVHFWTVRISVVRHFKLYCLGQDFFGIFVQVNILTQSLLTILLTSINPIKTRLGGRKGPGRGPGFKGGGEGENRRKDLKVFWKQFKL